MKNNYASEENNSRQQIDLPCFPEAQRLINEFVRKSEGKSELQRILLSQNLNKRWISSNMPRKLFPGFPVRNDYWFLVQLLSLHRYCLNESEVLDFNFAKPKTILLPNSFITEDYCERDIADRKIKEINSTRSVDSAGEMPWMAQHPQYDDLLRLSTVTKFKIPSTLLHLRGCRKRSDGTFSGLIGGNPMLGEWQYLDAIPSYIPTKKISFSYYFVLQSAKI